jgi:L-threonylcarbamoyladenylate synthase
MDTRTLPAAEPRSLAQAVEILRAGGVVAFPTDTVYGLGARAWDAAAVAQLYVAKGRAESKAIPILLASADALGEVADQVPPLAWALAARFWPGPLTLVVPRQARVPDVVTGGGDTVAVRVPNHPVALQLIKALGEPLAATSANLSGAPSPVSADDVLSQLRGRIPLILDGGPCPGGLASTVLDLTREPPVILRRGPVSREDLRAFVPDVLERIDAPQGA